MTGNENERQVTIGQNDWRNLLLTELKRTGGDPSILFEILEGIVQQRAWEKLSDTEGNPVGTLRRLIEAPPPIGCGQRVDKVLKLLDVEHRYEGSDKDWHQRMTQLRQTIRAELQKELNKSVKAKFQKHSNRTVQKYKKVSIYPSDIEKTVQVLKKVFDDDELRKIIYSIIDTPSL